LTHDNGEQWRGHIGAGIEQPGAVPHQCGSLGIRPHHDAGTIDQVQHRNIERVAQLHETRALVGTVGINRAGQMMRIIGDHAHWPTLHPNERDDDADAEFRADLQH
jgi:hypothetical protein